MQAHLRVLAVDGVLRGRLPCAGPAALSSAGLYDSLSSGQYAILVPLRHSRVQLPGRTAHAGPGRSGSSASKDTLCH